MNDLERRKKLLIAEAAVYRETLKLEFQNLRIYGLKTRRKLTSFRGGNPLRLEQIEKQLIDPLRRFEAELATRLAVLQHQQHILTVRDEPVPPQYREMVDKYFEMLSKKR
jgi:hypothetical protein